MELAEEIEQDRGAGSLEEKLDMKKSAPAMEAYRTETVIQPNRVLTVRDVPFRTGEKVEVIILGIRRQGDGQKQYPLRGKPIRYAAPFDSVAERDWEANR